MLLLLLLLHLSTLTHGATLHDATAAMPSLQHLDVKCGRLGMTVHMSFDQPFPGVIYSKGHYSDRACQYVSEQTAGRTNYTFLVPIEGCGTRGQLEESRPGRDMYFENTVIVQLDPLITEVWDEARLLKCVWPHTMLRRVKSASFRVVQHDRVSVEFDQRAVNTLMEIQRGPGPFDAPATGYVYMGDDTSVVIYVQDPDHSVDANVVNCSATSLGGETVQLIDTFGCLLRPDLITHFDKSRKTNGIKADLMLYSYLKAFRIGDSLEFTIRCQLEVCKGSCAEPCSNGLVLARRRRRRRKRGTELQESRPLLKVSDLVTVRERSNLLLEKTEQQFLQPKRVDLEQAVLVVDRERVGDAESWCHLSPSTVAAGLVLLGIIAALSLLSCFLAIKLSGQRPK